MGFSFAKGSGIDIAVDVAIAADSIPAVAADALGLCRRREHVQYDKKNREREDDMRERLVHIVRLILRSSIMCGVPAVNDKTVDNRILCRVLVVVTKAVSMMYSS